MPIYVNKNNDKFFVNVKNINSTNNYSTNSISDVFHPASSSNIYILNDGSNASLTLTTTFLSNVFIQWFLPQFEASSSGRDTSASRVTSVDITLFNSRKIFRKIRPPIFKFLKWQVSTDNGITFTDLDTGVDLYDANTWALKLDNLTVADDNKVYRCVAGMQEYTLLSKHAKINVEYWPDINTAGVSISSHPIDTLANSGSATFSVSASAPTGVSIAYQWQVSVNNGFSFVDIVGATSSTLNLTGLTREDHNKIYRVKVYRPDGPSLSLPEEYSAIFSKQARLLTLSEVDIVSHPQNTTASANNTAQFSVAVKPTYSQISPATPNYQWQISRDNGETYTDLVGQVSSTLNLSGLLINDHYTFYRVKISTSCCGTENFVIYSDSAILYTVSSTIVFQTQPVSISTINSQGKFTAQVRTLCPDSCGPILYQWAYVTGTDQDPIYTIIDGQTLNYLIVNAIVDNSKKFALIASQPQTNSIIISNTVTLTNANSKPTDIFLSQSSIKEGNSVGAAIGILSTQDVNTDGSYTYSLLDGFADKNSFTINNSTLQANASFNYATKSSYIIGIRSTDQGGLYVDKIFYIYIRTNVTVSLANFPASISEKSDTTTPIKIADIRITDPFNSGGYLSEENLPLLGGSPLSLSGNDAASFQINGLSLELKAGVVLNYSTKQTYNVTVNLNPPSEMSNSSSVNFTLTISDVNDRPTDLILFPTSILEDNAIGDDVGSFITIDPDINQNFTYQLVQDGNNPADYADNGFFNIPVGTNVLKASSVLKWTSSKTIYKIRVRTTDSGSPAQSFSKSLQVLLIKRPTPPPPPPQPPKPPDSVSGDPHYFLRAFSGQRLRAIIDDNIGGDPAIAVYVKIDNEEWKAVAVNTLGIVCSLDHIDYYYRSGGSTWTHLNPTQINGSWNLADSAAQIEFNKNGCFYFTGPSRGYASFYWNDPYELVKRDNIIVGGFLYWLQKAIEISNSTIDGGKMFDGEKLIFNSYWPSRRDAGVWNPTIGIDGITEVVSKFGLNRKDFLQSSGDSNLFKTTEKFNMFSSKVN